MSTAFDFYDDRIAVEPRTSLGHLQRGGEETLAAVVPWLRSVSSAGDRPIFLFLHLYEPHSPYEAPEPFRSRYTDPYDAEIAEADRVVGLLLAELDELSLYDDTLVLLLSDHGEGLGEHGQPHHEVFVYRESLQVPLLVKLPGGRRAGESVARPVQLVDVLPTIYDALDRPPPADLPGSSLLAPVPDEDRPIYGESLYPRIHFGWSELTSLIQGGYHYIEAPSPELYHLENDPGETLDSWRRERRLASRMAETLESYTKPFESPSAVDATTRERLAALGYVGTTVSATDEAERPDPKTRLAVLRPLAEAFRLFFDGDFEGAVTAFERIVELEPQLIDAWDHLGKSLYYLGRHEQAIEVYRHALEISQGAPNIALSTAEAYLEMGELDAARHHAELATTSHEGAWDVLAQCALRAGDLAAAERHIETALSLRGTRVRPLILEAELRLAQGQFEEALALTRAVEREASEEPATGRLSGLHFVRGQALAHLGQVDAAKRAFRREMEISPRFVEAYTHLAFLYALEGNGPEAGELLRRSVTENPTPAAYVAVIRTLVEMGDPRSAEAARRQALGLWPNNRRLLELDLP
jgi:tetratricopeptide (TPR) repeat protein